MCGIVGYVSAGAAERDAENVIIEGLRRLEYRGYDSAGVAVASNGVIECRKKAGKVADLEALIADNPIPSSNLGIGHTRWATHGGPTDVNAHPHVVGGGRLAVVHNGIIENFAGLKAELVDKGYTFVSETDTEVAGMLLLDIYDKEAEGDLTRAMQLTAQRLEGAFTLLAIHADHPDRIVAARWNSPLVIGVGEGENFLGSDVAGFIEFTRDAVEMDNGQIVTLTADGYEVCDFEGNPAQGKPFTVEWDVTAAEKGGYNSFMEKEIHDQPAAVRDTLYGRFDEDGKKVRVAKSNGKDV